MSDDVLFDLPGLDDIHVFVAGTGRVGATLLDQLAAEAPAVARRTGLRFVLAGIARSTCAAVDPSGLDLRCWRASLAAASAPPNHLIEAARRATQTVRVFVDCTASAEVADAYAGLLAHGVVIVSANKIAFSGPPERCARLRRLARRHGGTYAETTVGAGLPILRPIADMVATGDTVTRIEGVLSGTLSFIFGLLNTGRPFSRAVRAAHERGFTEPDPRDDLSGRDVARKLVILGREAGFDISAEDIRTVPLLPGDGWCDLSLDDFWKRLPEADPHFEARRASAAAADSVLACTAAIDRSGARLSVQAVPRSHPCASLSPGDNLVAVTSHRYRERPLVIQGPGAGPDVTAAGVFADLLRAGLEARRLHPRLPPTRVAAPRHRSGSRAHSRTPR